MHVETERGAVRRISITHSLPLLDEAAQRAVQAWNLAPGGPSEFDTTIEFGLIDDCWPRTTLETDIEAPTSLNIRAPVGCLIDPATSSPPPVFGSYIRGRLVCLCREHVPPAGTTIQLLPVRAGERAISATTNAAGQFELTAVPQGDYHWHVATPAFAEQLEIDRIVTVRRNGRINDAGTLEMVPGTVRVDQLQLPSYPVEAVEHNVEGRVHVQLTRNGAASIIDGDPVLAANARDNVVSWQIGAAYATPIVTYTYSLVEDCQNPNPHVTMKLPFEVNVVGKRRTGCGGPDPPSDLPSYHLHVKDLWRLLTRPQPPASPR